MPTRPSLASQAEAVKSSGATGQSSSSKASASWRQPCRAFSSEAERMTFSRVS